MEDGSLVGVSGLFTRSGWMLVLVSLKRFATSFVSSSSLLVLLSLFLSSLLHFRIFASSGWSYLHSIGFDF